MNLMIVSILIPAIAALLVLAIRNNTLRSLVAVIGAAANVAVLANLFSTVRGHGPLSFSADWFLNIPFALRLDNLSAFITLAAGGFGLLVVIYSWQFMQNHKHAGVFSFLLMMTLAMVNGAVMGDHLIVVLFFWEGMLGTLFGMIAVGREGAWKTATKALVIAGATDLCFILGITFVRWIGIENHQETMLISALAAKPLAATGLGAAAFIMLMIGAISKGGSMPFHSWIPDAAVDAPLPFMAFLPAALEKLMGIYFLSRITIDMFALKPGTAMSYVLMIIGAITILLAVGMALVQKDFKRLLSFHAISQVGYMILGVGTALPIGIVGGLFHMINNGLYKSCLFMTAGNVEKQAGTSDLRKMGGLGQKMPVTFVCFLIAAFSISGFPLTNGFYSKELVYQGALESHWVFYLAAVLGTVMTGASFLKMGHAAFLGKRPAEHENVKEAPFGMLVPAVVLAATCLVFGYNFVPLKSIIEPAVPTVMANVVEHGEHAAAVGEHVVAAAAAEGAKAESTFASMLPHNYMIAGFAVLALVVAFVNHLYGVKKSGSGVGAVDHIHHAPVLGKIYAQAEAGNLDPYRFATGAVQVFAYIGKAVDWLIDQMYESLAMGLSSLFSWTVRTANTGNYALYVVCSLAGAVAFIWYLLV